MIYKNKAFQYCVVILLILIILSLLKNMGFILCFFKKMFSLILIPVLIGILFYYMLRPIVRFFEKIKVKKMIGSIIASLSVIALIVISIVYGGSYIKNSISNSFYDIGIEIEQSLDIIENTFPTVLHHNEIQNKLNNYVKLKLNKISNNIPNFFSEIANVGTQIVIIPFVVFYFLKDDVCFARSIIKVCPKKYKKQIKDFLIEVDKTLSIYITGQLIVSLILGLFIYIGFKIIKLPNAGILSLFAMITNIIPFIGPFIGAVPALLVSSTLNLWMVVKVIIVSVIAQQLEGNVITPHIIGSRLDIHPLAVIIIVFISIAIFGVIGAFIGIPFYAVLRVAIKHIYKFYNIMHIETGELK